MAAAAARPETTAMTNPAAPQPEAGSNTGKRKLKVRKAARQPTVPASQPAGDSAPAGSTAGKAVAASGSGVPAAPVPSLLGQPLTSNAVRPGTQTTAQPAASHPEAGSATGRRIKLKVRKAARIGAVPAAGDAPNSGHSSAGSAGITFPLQAPASQHLSAPQQRQPAVRPAAIAPPPAHPPPQHPPQRPPPRDRSSIACLVRRRRSRRERTGTSCTCSRWR